MGKKIVGYFPDWGIYDAHRNYEVSQIPWDKLTHVNLAFVDIMPVTFKLKPADAGADLERSFGEAWKSKFKGNYGQLRKYKAKYPHVSVMMSIGGWTLSGQFGTLANDTRNVELFAKNSVAYMVEHGFDGIDIDWEFPTIVRTPDKIDNKNDQGTPYETAASKELFTKCLKALREELTKQGKTDGKYYQLTAAIGSSTRLIHSTEPDKYAQYLDFINIMSYDMHGAWEKITNHQSPLYKNPALPTDLFEMAFSLKTPDGRTTLEDNLTVDSAIKLLTEEYKIPKKKLVIGTPFYTRGWKGVDCSNLKEPIKNKNGSDLPGLGCSAKGGAKGLLDGGRAAGVSAWFHYVNKTIPGASTFTTYMDEYAKVPYMYSEERGEFYTLENEKSEQSKVDYVNDNELGGIIIWELSEDVNIKKDGNDIVKKRSLIKIIKDGFYPLEGKTIESNVAKVKSKPIDNDQTLQKQQEGNKRHSKDKAAADIGGAIAAYDPKHGPSTNPHYNKGEQVLFGSKLCTAKWYAGAKPKGDNTDAWNCEDSKNIVPVVKLDENMTKKVKDKAKEIVKRLKDAGTGTINLPNNGDNNITKEAEKIAKKVKEKVKEEVKKEVKKTLSKEVIEAHAKEANRCHLGQIYNNGDMCKMGEKWLKFKWWTKFEGKVETSMQAVTPRDEDIPKIKVIPANNIAKWSSRKTYSKKGMKVVYNNNVYESKYWTQANMPKPFVSGTPWKHLGIADMTNDAENVGVKPPSKEEVKNAKLTKKDPILVGDDNETTTAFYNKGDGKTIVVKLTPKDNVKQTVAGDKFFMPFVDIAIWPPYKLQDGMDSGIKNFSLAFVNSAGSCSPTWASVASYTINNDTLNLPKQIKEVAKAGGHIMVSFGGATAGVNELANTCTTVDTLADAYQSVIDDTGVKMIDFDIEGHNSSNKVNVLRRMKALKIIQDKNPDVEISFTLATMPTGLLAPSGLMIVKTAIDENVKFKMINLMLMDYGGSFPAETEGELKMAAYSIQALQSVNAQLKVLLKDKTGYPAKVNGEFYNILGATPMIGRNDVLKEWFYKDDIEKLTKFCNEVGVRMTSMWSINRDKAIASGESGVSILYQSTKLTKAQYGNEKYKFSKLLKEGRE